MFIINYKKRILYIFIIALTVQVLVKTSVNAQQKPTNTRQLVQEEITKLPSKEKRWALIIGVDKYEDGGITSLRGAANDARELASALQIYSGFPESQTILLTTDEPRERQPTRQNILRRLSNLKGLVPKDGLLLISFSGHGIERGGQAFLIPSDATFTEDISLLEETALNVERIRNQIRATQVQQVLILLDACRNDPTGGRADSSNPLTEAYKRGFSFDVKNREVSAFATLYATSVGSRAYEFSEKQQGYFTWAIIEALSGKATNQTNNEVTLGSLIRYVEDIVPKRVAIDLGVTKKQIPFAVVEGYKADNLVLAIGRTSTEPTQIQTSKTRIDISAVEKEFWDSIKNSTDADDFRFYKEKFPNGSYTALADLKIKQLTRQTTKVLPVYTQEECEELYKRYTDNYKGTLEQRKMAIEGGEQFIAKCARIQGNAEVIKYLNDKIPTLKKKTAFEEAINRFNAATIDSKNVNAYEAFASGREILAENPDLVDVLLVLATIGFDKAAAATPVDTYNADTINYAKQAIQKIEDGATSKQYGTWSYIYKTKEYPDGKSNALGWMNYTIGYIMYNRQNQKKEALPYLYKALQYNSNVKKNPAVYQAIGDWYKEEYNRIDDERTKLAAEARGKTPEEAKPLIDRAMELLRLQKGYAVRMLDAYARAYMLAGTDQAYKTALYNNLKVLYTFRFDGRTDGLDEYIKDITNRPIQDPNKEVVIIEQ